MTTEEIKKLTDDDLMLELARRILPDYFNRHCHLGHDLKCTNCHNLIPLQTELPECEKWWKRYLSSLAAAAFAARNWMLKTNLIYKWEGIVAKLKTGSMHEIDYQAVIDASPRQWIEAAIIVIEEQSHET